MIKFLTKYKWYRRMHLRDFIPDDLKEVYDNINSGVPNDLERTLQVLAIVNDVLGD